MASVCDVCQRELSGGVAPWHFECPSCGTEGSSLSPTIGTEAASTLDEAGRAKGLRATRARGYERLLDHLTRARGPARGSLLEVGSAHGWFLEAAASAFDRTVGIEPDDHVRVQPGAAEVRSGYFPSAVGQDERFDVIVFNDVFEHIRPTDEIAKAVATTLQPGGLAVINLPVSSGAIYRLSKLLYRLGVRSPFERMWQIGFPSPHLYYFSEEGLRLLFERHGLELHAAFDMPTMHGSGLWQRIRHAEPNLAVALASYVSSLVVLPATLLLPADVRCLLFRRTAP